MKKLLSLISFAMFTGTVGAALLVEETWNYGIGSASTEWTGGVGFVSTAWSTGATGTTLAEGLSFGHMPVSGGSAHIQYNAGTGAGGATLGRQLSIATVNSGDLWMAYLFKFDTARSTIASNEALEIRPGAGNIRTGINETTSAVNLRYGTDTTTSVTDALVKSGQTLLYVTKFPDMGSETGSDAKGWLLTVSDYNSIVSGGITEAALDAAASLTLSNSFAANVTMAGNVTLQLVPFGRNESTPSFYVDEIRIGTSLADVVAIPEPATIGLLGIATISLMILRRFR